MKTRIMIFVSAVLATLSSSGQECIGQQFTLDTIVVIQGEHMPGNPYPVKCKMQGDTFYFVEQKGFQDKENGYQAVIHALATDDYEQMEIRLPLPESDRPKGRYAQSLWIYDFCFEGDYLLVTTQEQLILYKRIHNQNYRVESTYRHQNLYMGYLHQNKIHFFEEDHDKGFKWFQQDLGGDSATLVRELPYEAPHVVQIQPNRYLFHNQQSVFFLSTRHPRVEVYDLEGHIRDTIRFDLPHWKAFEDEYILKTLAVPYGIERIYAVKDELYDYSYPKVAMPLRGDLLLLYMQFDTLTGKSALQYAIRTEDGRSSRFLRSDHEDSAYLAARFPFTLFQGGFDKGNACGKDKIVQLTYKTDVSWHGKTPTEYQREVNSYFEKSKPSLAYKIMRYAPQEKVEPTLFTSSGDRVVLREMPAEKSIFLLHQDLECSGCVKALYNLLETSATKDLHLGHVYPNPVRGLQAYELTNRIRRELNKPFTLYYDTSGHYVQLCPTPLLHESDFPCVMFYEKGKPPRLFRSNEIFTDNFSITEFQGDFLNAWHSFVEQ